MSANMCKTSEYQILFKKKMFPARLELPKTNQQRKTSEGVRAARVLEKGLLKIPNILHY